MKRIVVILTGLALLLSFQEAEAQNIKSLIRKKIMEDQLEAQAKRDSARAVEEGREPEKSPTTMEEVYLEAFGLSGDVDYESSYSFDAFIRMEVKEYRSNKQVKEEMVYDSYVNKGSVDYAMVFSDRDDHTTVIFDSKNSAMLMLTESDGEKTGFAMGMDPEEFAEEVEEQEEEYDSSPYKPYKTGKTKTILGYSCDEYLMDDEDAEVHMWVSEKLGKQVRKEILNNKQTFGAAFYHAAYLNGMVLEYDFLDKQEGERSVMQVTDIDLNHSHSISTRGYTIMSMKVPPSEE